MKSNQSKNILALAALALLFLIPLARTFAFTPDSYSGLVKCSGVTLQDLKQPTQGGNEVDCNFQTFIGMIGSIISWLFFISVPIAVAIFAWAGLLYMSGKDENKKRARTIFLNVVIGFIIMLVAYICVQTLVGWLVNPSSGAATFLSQ